MYVSKLPKKQSKTVNTSGRRQSSTENSDQDYESQPSYQPRTINVQRVERSENSGSDAHHNFGQRHVSAATVLNDIDTSLKSLRPRVNEGFEKVGINFSNLVKMQQVTK